jgi:hypothetical protein
MVKKWIQKTGIKKGALSKQIGVPIEKNIPMKVLNKITSTEVGRTVTVPKGKVKVTLLLKRRAVMAKNLKKIKR